MSNSVLSSIAVVGVFISSLRLTIAIVPFVVRLWKKWSKRAQKKVCPGCRRATFHRPHPEYSRIYGNCPLCGIAVEIVRKHRLIRRGAKKQKSIMPPKGIGKDVKKKRPGLVCGKTNPKPRPNV